MLLAMLLAHLVGDYVLQWDALARWKSRELKGVLVHGAIVLSATWLFSVPFDTGWWPWAVFVGLTHTAVDALWLGNRFWRPGAGLPAFARLLLDQAVHLSLILVALAASGYLWMPSSEPDLVLALRDNRLLVFALAYVFITTPAWILVEFSVFGLLKRSAPDFS